jgi:hypothetical protein
MRLVPAARREWVEAVWAEAADVSPGWPRLAWQVGGVRLIAREALLRRGVRDAALFTVAAGLSAWGAWRGSPANLATAEYRTDVITVVTLLAVLPILARWVFGPATDSGTARRLRVGTYAAVLALITAKHVVARILDAPPRNAVDLRLYRLIAGHTVNHSWSAEIVLLVIVGLYVAGILWATSRRSGVAPSTLAIGTGAGIALGVVMYAVAPLGLSNSATNPWLPGSDIDPLVVLAWLVLLFGPLAAAIIADRHYTAASSSPPSRGARSCQILTAGLLANLLGALIVSVATTGTTALMIKTGWLRSWLYHGHHRFFGVDNLRALLADPSALAYSHQITAAVDAAGGGFLFISIPFAALAIFSTGIVVQDAWADHGFGRDEPRRGDGPDEPRPPSDPPDGAPLDHDADDRISSAAGLRHASAGTYRRPSRVSPSSSSRAISRCPEWVAVSSMRWSTISRTVATCSVSSPPCRPSGADPSAVTASISSVC